MEDPSGSKDIKRSKVAKEGKKGEEKSQDGAQE